MKNNSAVPPERSDPLINLLRLRSDGLVEGKTIVWDALTGLGKTQKMIDCFYALSRNPTGDRLFYACDTIELALEFMLNIFSRYEAAKVRLDNIHRSLHSKFYCMFDLYGSEQSDLISKMHAKWGNRYSKHAWDFVRNIKAYASFSDKVNKNTFMKERFARFSSASFLVTTHESLKMRGDMIAQNFKFGFIDEVPNWTLEVSHSFKLNKNFFEDVVNFQHDHKSGREIRSLAMGLKSGMIIGEEFASKDQSGTKNGETDGWIVTRFNFENHPFERLVVATAFPALSSLAELQLHSVVSLPTVTDKDNSQLANIYRKYNEITTLNVNGSLAAITAKNAKIIADDIIKFANGAKILVVATSKVEACLRPYLTDGQYIFIRTNCRGLNSYSDISSVYIASDINFEPRIKKYFSERFGIEEANLTEDFRSAGMNTQSMYRGCLRDKLPQRTRVASGKFYSTYQVAIASYSIEES